MKLKTILILCCSLVLLLPFVSAETCNTQFDCNDCNSWTKETCNVGQCEYQARIDSHPFNGNVDEYQTKVSSFLGWMDQQGYSQNVIDLYEYDLQNGELASLLMQTGDALSPMFSHRDRGRTSADSNDYMSQLLYDFKHDQTFVIDFVELRATDSNIVNYPIDDTTLNLFANYLTEKFKRPIIINKIVEEINFEQTFGQCSGCGSSFLSNPPYQVPMSSIGYSTDSSSITLSGTFKYTGTGILNYIGGNTACENNGNIYFNAARTFEDNGNIYQLFFPTSGIRGCNAAVGSLLDFSNSADSETARWAHEFTHVLGIPHMVWDLYNAYITDPISGVLEVQRYMFGSDSIMFIPGYVGKWQSGVDIDSRGYYTMIEEFDPLTLYLLEPVNGYPSQVGANYNAKYTIDTISSHRQEVCGFGQGDVSEECIVGNCQIEPSTQVPAC